ncbi:MAG: MATE family efflux transporter, partial [Clostridia bacterium]
MKKTWRDYLGAQDMTQGSPLVNLITFSIPLLIGNFAQQMYNTVDSIIVGRYVGDMALAAVGASNPILNLLLVLFMGISTGAGIMVSQYFGAHQQQELSRTVGTCLILTFFTSLLIMGLGCLASRPLLTLLHTPPEIYDMAADYLLIIFLGILTAAYYNILSGILRGLGDSLSPLLFLLVACALNIVLDIWFVAGFGWASMRHVVRCDRSTLRMDRATSLQIARLGLPSGITQAIFSLAMIVVQSLTNSFGPLVITTTTAVMRVDGFAMMPNF